MEPIRLGRPGSVPPRFYCHRLRKSDRGMTICILLNEHDDRHHGDNGERWHDDETYTLGRDT